MGASRAAGPRRAGGRRGRRRAARPGRTVVAVIVSSLLALGVLTGVGVSVAYRHWNGNLDVEDVDAQLGPDRPENAVKGQVNILVLGDDTREGKRNKLDTASGGGSDTTILIHLSADRTFAYGISIPRDVIVDRPACTKKDGTVVPAQPDALWNAAYTAGGQACTIKQFEKLTGVRADKYVVVKFSGFKDMVNALGGVEVCIPERIVDPETHITLDAGTRRIEGDEALAYVRVRKGVAGGDGSDPQRIKRQQAFMSSMINGALRADMLARPDKLLSLVNATTRSLTTNFENVAQMADLAGSLRSIGLDNISFVTTPWEAWPQDPKNRIQWTSSVARLWSLVRRDKPLTPEFEEQAINAATNPDGAASTSPSASGSPSGPASGSPGQDASSEAPVERPRSAGLC